MAYINFQVIASVVFSLFIPIIIICSLIFSKHANQFDTKDLYTVIGVLILVITLFIEISIYIYLVKNLKKIKKISNNKKIIFWSFSTLLPILINGLILLIIARKNENNA